MHKDLTDIHRARAEGVIAGVVRTLHEEGQSLALAREAMIEAFDRTAEELDGGEGE